jgi:hypothetical protein
MDSLRRVEEDLRNLAIEFRKKYPEVMDATEHALSTLKTMREMYVADKMRKSGLAKEDVKIPQSSDILSPYILACNYADANPKLILMALNGIQMLVSFEMIPASDVKNLLRVFSIQAASGKPELQLKILQMLLHLASLLSAREDQANYLTEPTVRGFFNIMLSMSSDGCSMSVSTTALATTRQMVAIILDPLRESTRTTSMPQYSREVKEGFSKSAVAFVGDLTLYAKGDAGEWCRGIQIQQNAAFDLLDYTMTGWRDVFLADAAFSTFVKESIFPTLKAMMRDLQEEYAHQVIKDGIQVAAAFASRVVRLARTFLLNFTVPGFLDEVDTVANLMVHALTSDFDFEQNSPRGSGSGSDSEREPELATSSMMGGAQALIGGLGARFQMSFSGSKDKDKPQTGTTALKSAYLALSGSTSRGSYLASPQSVTSKPSSRLLAHPAGACLEALLAFFLLNIPSLLALEGGRKVVTAAMENTVQSACTVLSQALNINANIQDFVAATQDSKIISLLEGYLSGHETDAESVVCPIHEGLGVATISGAQTLILAFYAVQVISRQLVEFALVGSDIMDTEARIFVDRASIPDIVVSDAISPSELGEIAAQVAGTVHEDIQEACSTVLSAVTYPLIVRRGVGIFSEMAVVTSLLRLKRPSEAVLSSLCRFTVPAWHGQGLVTVSSSSTPSSPVKDSRQGSATLQWKHVQAIVRLSQTVHALANIISDWDSIVDAFEQITDCILDPKTAHADDVTSAEIESVLLCLERFKQYSVFLSDNALTKLMTSLVAMSLNNLAVTARSTSSTGDGDDWRAARVTDAKLTFSVKSVPPGAPAYMVDGISSGMVSFSLQATVEIAKMNAHRSQCVWQMVTSHLKMVANLKSSIIRTVAVASTFDLIGSMLKFLHAPQLPSMDTVDNSQLMVKSIDVQRSACVSDDVLFTSILPSSKSTFLPRRRHLELLLNAKAEFDSKSSISQADVMASAKVLAGIRFDDVRTGVMNGLMSLLQGDGDILSQEGWTCVLILISVAPASLVPSQSTSSSTDDMSSLEAQTWPVEAVAGSFNCMKLILDEYMECIELGSMTSVITCLSMFSSQLLDVNISLTSLELLWKVYDQTMRGRSGSSELENTKQEVFNITTTQLLGLSMDTRPEVRHCAMNTLFAALTMTANASLTTGEQWKQIFDDVIFPLFERAGARTTLAIESKEEANAPELKKGKKMILHHSRDTAFKQWSETRVLALRGLTRVVKTCAVLLIQEEWFRSTWATALDVCKKATETAVVDQEVALASFDVMFAMLKIVSEESFATDSNNRAAGRDEQQVQICRNDMWLSTWTAVNNASKFNGQCPDVALHICQNLLSIYEGGAEKEFAGMGNLRDVCDCIVTLSRPRLVDGEGKKGGMSDMQLYRQLVNFLKVLTPKDVESVSVIGSAIIELCFTNQYVQMPSTLGDKGKIFMGPCPQKFRDDVCEFYMNSFLTCVIPTTVSTFGTSILDTVFKRFITDICGLAISLRSESAHTEVVTPVKAPVSSDESTRSESKQKQLGFFSFLAGATDDNSDTESAGQNDEEGSDLPETPGPTSMEPKTPGPVRSELNFHTLKQCAVPGKSNSSSWTSFYPLMTELKVLTRTLQHCLTAVNFNTVDEATRENIFSTFLCFFSPWRANELPGAKESYGPFLKANHLMAPPLLEALDVIYGFAREYPKSNWTIGLISSLVEATRLQIHAIVESDQEDANSKEEKASMLSIWRKVSEILFTVASTSMGVNSRRMAIDSILKLNRDMSYGVLENKRRNSHSKQVLEEGCIIFMRCLLQLESNLDDTPKTFNGRKSQEKEILQSWLLNMTDPLVEELWEEPVQPDESKSFSKKGHLFIFLPVAFKLLQCDCEEVKDIVHIITSTVDIAALIDSYCGLQSQVNALQPASPK